MPDPATCPPFLVDITVYLGISPTHSCCIVHDLKIIFSSMWVKLKLQYFGQLMWRADSLEKILMLGKIEGKRRRGSRGWDGMRASPTERTWIYANSRRQWRTGEPGVLQSVGSRRAGMSQRLNNNDKCAFRVQWTFSSSLKFSTVGANIEESI